MKIILLESFLVIASVLLWLIVLPLAALLSPVLIPLLARAAKHSPIVPREDDHPHPRRPCARQNASVPPPVQLLPAWRLIEKKA